MSNPETSETDLINSVQDILTSQSFGDKKTLKLLLSGKEDAIAVNLYNHNLVINVDGWVASTDRPPHFTPFDCGYRATMNAISDLIAKQAKPLGVMASICLPKKEQIQFKKIVEGIVKASNSMDTPYFGGDLNQANDLIIDITVFGINQKTKIPARANAKVDELLCWLGPPLGETKAALEVLLGNFLGDIGYARKIYAKPSLDINFLDINTNCSMDCSDGLIRSLYQIVESSGVGIELNKLENQNEWVESIIESNRTSFEELAYYGGEELGMLFTIELDKEIPKNTIVLGKIITQPVVKDQNGIIENRGFEHFS